LHKGFFLLLELTQLLSCSPDLTSACLDLQDQTAVFLFFLFKVIAQTLDFGAGVLVASQDVIFLIFRGSQSHLSLFLLFDQIVALLSEVLIRSRRLLELLAYTLIFLR
jgi:hypothetical protein